jgi:hypothetical protein
MDGDRYHKALKQHYQQLYKQIGQHHFTPEELAHNALRPLLKDVKAYGDDVVALLGQAADEIEHRLNPPLLRNLSDRDTLKQEIEQRMQHLVADRRGKTLALSACEHYIDDLDATTDVTDVRATLIRNYLLDVYTANFESVALSSPGTTSNVPHDQVRAQLPHIREHVEGYAAQIAHSVAKTLSFDQARMPTAPRASEVVQLDEILSLP